MTGLGDRAAAVRDRVTPDVHLRYEFARRLSDVPTPALRAYFAARGTAAFEPPERIPCVESTLDGDAVGGVPVEPVDGIERDRSTVYPCGNDVFDVDAPTDRPQAMLAVGNQTSLDVASRLDPDVVYFVDVNPSQLEYLRFFAGLVVASPSRAAFVARLYGKEASAVAALLDRLDPDLDPTGDDALAVEDAFWRLPDDRDPRGTYHADLLDHEYVTDDGRRTGVRPASIGTSVFGKMLIVPTLVRWGDNELDHVERDHSFYPLYRPGGFLSSDERYERLRSILRDREWLLANREVSADLAHFVADSHPDRELHVWLSNVLYPSWVEPRHVRLVEKLEYLRRFRRGAFGVQVWEDDRVGVFDNRYET